MTNGVLGAGQLASVDGPWPNDTVSLAYDALGRLTNRAIHGVGQGMAFDALGRVTTLTNALGTFTHAYAGDTGRLLTNAFPNGQRTVLQWLGTNNDVRLASIHHLDPASATLSKFDHAYDADGQLTAWTQQAGNVSTNVYSLGYDRAGQLLDAVLRQAGPAGALVKRYAYAYDAAGNRTGEQAATDTRAGVHACTHPAAETANALNPLTARAGGPCFRHRAGRTR